VRLEYNSVSPAPFWGIYEIDQNNVVDGVVVNTTEGVCVQCTAEGTCKVVLAPIGTSISLFKIDKYRLMSGHADYYNEKGKKGEWSEPIEVVESPVSPLVFTLSTAPEVSYTKLVIYGVATAGLFIGGSLAAKSKNPAISKVSPIVKYSSIIPGALTVIEGGKIVVRKVEDIIPW
jgi:hypothetical protein